MIKKLPQVIVPDTVYKDAERYRWLKRNTGEQPTPNSNRGEFSENKCMHAFPMLISWADFCGQISLDFAIDTKIEREANALLSTQDTNND